MNEHLLTEIEIQQFKCFSNFKASGFKRINLLGGKNNIGKTAFIEACFINLHSTNVKTMITAIIGVKYVRESLNVIGKSVDYKKFLDFTKNYAAKSNINNTAFSIIENDAIKKYKFTINGESKTINANDLNIVFESVDNIDFIDNFGLADYPLLKAFQAIQKQDKENDINNAIHEFDDSIENFKVIGDKPQCKTNGHYRDLSEFGDGLRHYISIICNIYACKNGYLFIDEIGSGIHYTQLDRLWELIFKLSKENNCQIFAITHSKEVLESFALVAQKLAEQDISYTTMVKNKQQDIQALTRDYHMLLDSIEQEREVRGW